MGENSVTDTCAVTLPVTEALLWGRKLVLEYERYYREYLQGFERMRLVATGALLGIRETRHATCTHKLTEREVLEGVRFEDAIANGSYPVDIHHADGPGITFRYLDGTERVIEERGLPAREGRWRDPLP